MKILIVDDEPGTRLTVSEAVERLGHRALQAADGEEGLRAFEFHHPEILITDWAMPELDGTELIARIRDRELDHDYTYILLLTGRAGEAASREAVRAGADDVLAKPLDAAELERKLIAAERIRGVHRRMREDARRDPLTGAGSRQRLEEDLASVCARVVRYGHAYCIAMVGLEPAGDDVLRRAGSALVREIRSGDAVYRSGPGEFAVLLPEQALETANLAAERLRRALTFAVPDDTKVNVGIVTTSGTDPEPAELLKLAETAMRRSSETGGVEDSESARSDTLRLVVADDDPVSRLMLGAILKREPGFELVGEAEDAGQAVEIALRRRPDVVLLDVDMPGGGGARAAVQIREQLPETRIVAISADDSQSSQYDMMRAGAVGFVIKGSSDDEILRVIRSSTRW
jgi:diguanylate cyclase (GGDEF)-like protein